MKATTATAPKTQAALPNVGRPPRTVRTRRRFWRTLLLGSLISLVSAVVAGQLSQTGPIAGLELKTYDLRFLLTGQRPAPPGIVLVLVDELSEARFPEPRIFWHRYYANLLRAAASARAKALGVDVYFTIPVDAWLPDADRMLAEAFLEASGSLPVVLGYHTLEEGPAALPIYLFASTQDAIGFTNFTVDPDGFVRRQELTSHGPRAASSFVYRLAQAVASQEQDSGGGQQSTQGEGLGLGGQPVPLDSAGFLMIHYWGPAGTFASVSLADVNDAFERGDTAQLERWFRDKVVLLGSFFPPADMHPTPFYLAAGQRWRATPGVEVHANTLATLLEGRYLREARPAASGALTVGGAALAAFLVFAVPFPWGPLGLGVGALGYLAASVYAQAAGLVLPVVAPVLATALSALGASGISALTEGRQKRLLKDMFGRYVSPEISRELLERGDIPLGGTRQPLTVMFSDLRNYTHYCQNRDPVEVVRELNEYFSDMTAAIKQHGGMVNKFLGDGIMALFGAPVPHPDDAVRAVRCGLDMLRRNEAYNRRRQESGMEPLIIGIGIHTGEAVVGTIGAPEKMEYTAIGDTVNVASRIEGENKKLGTRLLISSATYDQVRDAVRAEPAGTAMLKGIDEGVVLYTIKV